MKKNILILISIIFCTSTFGQKAKLRDFIDFTLPSKTEQITGKEYNSQAKKPKKDDANLRVENLEFYKVGNNKLLRIKATVLKRKVEKDFVEKTKAGFDEMHRWGGSSTDYKSEIININNYKAVLMSYVTGNTFYIFCSAYGKNMMEAVTIRFECNKSDKQEGELNFNTMLKTIKFKD